MKMTQTLSRKQFVSSGNGVVLHLANPLDANYLGIGNKGDVLDGVKGDDCVIGVEDSDGTIIAHPSDYGAGAHETAHFEGNVAVWIGWGKKSYMAPVGN